MSLFTSAKLNGLRNCTQINTLISEKYVEDVLNSMLVEQSDHIFSKFSDAYVTHRRVVVEWMIDVAEYFKLHITTSHAAITYLDRLQPTEKCSRFEWQMMAICCLIISSKYNECEENVPPLHKLEEIAQQVLTNECVLYYELWALKKMGWKLNARTPVAFLESYLLLSRRIPLELISEVTLEILLSYECEAMSYSLATKCIVDHRFKPLPASAIATGILYHTLDSYFSGCVSKTQLWCASLTKITGHDALNSRSVQQVLSLLDYVFEEERMKMNKENNPLYNNNNTSSNSSSSQEHHGNSNDNSSIEYNTDDSAIDLVVEQMNDVTLQEIANGCSNNNDAFTSPENNMKGYNNNNTINIHNNNNNNNNMLDNPKTDLSPVSIANFDQVEC